MICIDNLLSMGAEKLKQQFHHPRWATMLLLAHLLKVSNIHILAYPYQLVDKKIILQFKRLINQAAKGKPLAYLLSQQQFCGLNLKVTAATLIPRIETELLVEHISCIYGEKKQLSILDLGTGSGAIALALANRYPHWQITATDISTAALAVARYNKKQHELKNIYFLKSNWFSKILKNQRFHVIVSNPPYIAFNDSKIDESVKKFEPHQALFSPEYGLRDLKHIIFYAKDYLYPNGMLAVEHGYQQHTIVKDLFSTNMYQNVCFLSDEQDIIRVCYGHK